jgi:hypothetical protein
LSNVLPEQIKAKLQTFEVLEKLIVAESEKNGGRLPRHEHWRRAYYKSPYMIGSCDERISTRFRNVFMNLNELDSNGKIVPRPDFAKDDSLHQKFTHLLEELNSRSSSGQGRLPESLHFAESDVILGGVRARSVHKVSYGHNCNRAAA